MFIVYVLPNLTFGPGLAFIVFRVVVFVVVVVHIYPPITGQCQTLNIGQFVHVLLQGQLCAGGIRTCLRVSSVSMFLWVLSISF